jgi:hypothetical protein
MGQTQQIKAKKGQTIYDLVESRGFPSKDWKKIVNAPYNKKFLKRNPRPNMSIQAGDTLVLPQHTPQSIMNAVVTTTNLIAKIAKMDKKIKILRDGIKKISATSEHKKTKAMIKDLQKRAKELREEAANAHDECAVPGDCPALGGDRKNGDAEVLLAEAKRMESLMNGAKGMTAGLIKALERQILAIQLKKNVVLKELMKAQQILKNASKNPY